MKSNAMILVVLVSVFLVFFTALTLMDVRFDYLFYLMMIGQFLVVIMVYKVLTDQYETDKTFDNWYEDDPRNTD